MKSVNDPHRQLGGGRGQRPLQDPQLTATGTPGERIPPGCPAQAGSGVASSRGIDPALLDRHPRFSGMDAEDLSGIAAVAELWLVPGGHVLFRRGDTADGVYLVLDGTVVLESTARDVARTVAGLAATFGDGALTGEPTRRHTATAACSSVLVKVPLPDLKEVLRAYPQVAGDWAWEVMARRARQGWWAGRNGLVDRVLGLFDAA